MKFIVLLFCITSLKILAQGVVFNEDLLIKNTEGGFVNLKSFDSIIGTNLYTLKVELNDDKSLSHLQILNKTVADFTFEKQQKLEQEALSEKPFVMRVPDFTVIDNNGDNFTLGAQKDKVIFMHFGSSKYEKSYEFVNEINELHNFYKNNDKVKVMFFNFDDNLSEEEKKEITSKVNVPIVFNARVPLHKYGQDPLPKYYVVGKGRTRAFGSPEFKGVDFFKQIISKEFSKPSVNE